MDAATIRATCPNCQATLRIPAEWAGQIVKCKKCGSGVRTVANTAPVPDLLTSDPVEQNGHADFATASPAAGTPFGEMTRTRAVRDNPFDSGADHPSPGYPYPAPPPGYGGYPYPPPGYGPPPGYAMPPGYPYAPPAGYEPPPGYAPVPGYAPAPGYEPPAAYQPPPYQPPAHPLPPPAPAGPSMAAQAVAGFKPSEALSTHSRKGGYRRGSDRGKYIWIGVALVLTGGLVVGAIAAANHFKKPHPGPGEPTHNGGGGDLKPVVGPPKNNPLGSSGNFPRRLLFIHISNYLYLNPLTHSQVDGKIHGADLTKPAANRLATEWRVPNDQIFLLSDTAPGNDRRAPMKDVLSGTYERFFDSSRAQDRIVVYFGGHVLTKDGKTFLVPIEGDPDEPEKLVPLDDFYAKMKACKATQKIVIWDVARYNPERGRNRPGSEPLAEETATALASPPAGVQAVLTCQPGENALEFYNAQPDGFGNNKLPVIGSNFLSAARYVSDKNRNNAKQQNPDDAIAIDSWSGAIGQRTSEVAAAEAKGKQTVKVAGTAPTSLVAFNKEAAAAARFEFPPSPKSASPMEVNDIAMELALPSIKKDDGSSGIGEFPFPAEALAPYKSDVPIAEIRKDKEKYRFRNSVLDAFETITAVFGAGSELLEELREKSSDALKKKVLDLQKFPALGISKIERAIFFLESVAGEREKEPKRWQAHYDYAMAQCKSRLAWLHEYNLALGNIRTETLPPLDEKKGQDGYRLVAQEKMKVKKEGKLAEEAKEIYMKIIEENKGSPWAILAKRDRMISLGLAWQPASFGTIMPEPEPGPGTPESKGPAAGAVTFTKAQAILQTHCVSCHGTPQMRANIDFRTLDSIKKKPGLLVAGNPGASDMWNAIMSDTMPPPDAKTKLTAAEKQIIKDWITAGAK